MPDKLSDDTFLGLFHFCKNGPSAFFAAAVCIGMFTAAVLMLAANASAANQTADDDAIIAKSLATMLRAGRTVISRNQDKINDARIGDKGLDGKIVLAEAVKIYREASGVEPASIDASSRHGRLLRMEMDAIVEVLDVRQQNINRKGVGFKGFIPAVFGRLVSESFGRRASGFAEMKVTAPPKLIRNATARADEWESMVISDKLMSPSWPKDQIFSEVSQTKGKAAYRTAMPEYYGATCLSCHGSPAGEIDITGYPKEGANVGDLGGVISITLFR
jgi:Protein of unknown function (DUF3365)